jgi:hypothetical protein
MVVVFVISVVVVIAGTVAAMRLPSMRARDHDSSGDRSATTPDRPVSRIPVRLGGGASLLASTVPPAKVEVLAEYRKARARRVPQRRAAAGCRPRTMRPQRPEPA